MDSKDFIETPILKCSYKFIKFLHYDKYLVSKLNEETEDSVLDLCVDDFTWFGLHLAILSFFSFEEAFISSPQLFNHIRNNLFLTFV